MELFKLGDDLDDEILISIDDFILLLLAEVNIEFLQLLAQNIPVRNATKSWIWCRQFFKSRREIRRDVFYYIVHEHTV